MLQGGFTEVLKTRNQDEFRGEIVAFTKRLGFETVSATVVIDHMLGQAEFITVDNTPNDYKQFFENREQWRQDPVMQHCKRHSMPIIWSQDTYTTLGMGDKWEEQAPSAMATASRSRCTCPKDGTSSWAWTVIGRSPSTLSS